MRAPATVRPTRTTQGFPASVAALATLAVALVAAPATAGGDAPILVMDEARATGFVVRSPDGPLEVMTVELRDSLRFGHPPRDTVPTGSRLDFRWHAETVTPGSHVVGYRYKLDEPEFVSVDSSVRSVSYSGDEVVPGSKLFTLRAVDSEGRVREITRHFLMNIRPDTWFAGPDSLAVAPDPATGERYVDVADWTAPPALPGSLLGCDSLTLRPAERWSRKTFLEIYGNRLYLRAEDDTVHMNSWVVLHGGGSDLDSPYSVVVGVGDPALEDTAACAAAGEPKVVRRAGQVGSPVGMRYAHGNLLDPGGPFVTPAASGLLPSFDPASVFYAPRIAAYAGMAWSGRVYLTLRSEDGDRGQDGRVAGAAAARRIADRVDAGIGTPEEVALRSKILTFYVNKAPFLRMGDPAFVPKPDQEFASRTLSLNLLAGDRDPYDATQPPPRVGGPSPAAVLRWNVTLEGRDAAGLPVSHAPLAEPVFTPRVTVTVPDRFADPHVTVVVQLCDCAYCEIQFGSGRCVTQGIPIRVPPPVGVGPSGGRAGGLALEGARPNPAVSGELTVWFRLPGSEPARLEVLDTSGRRLVTREVGSLGRGRHALALGARIPAGVYWLRLTQGRETRVARAAVLE